MGWSIVLWPMWLLQTPQGSGTVLGVSRMARICSHPRQFIFLTSGWSTAELPEVPIFWSSGCLPPAMPTYELLSGPWVQAVVKCEIYQLSERWSLARA